MEKFERIWFKVVAAEWLTLVGIRASILRLGDTRQRIFAIFGPARGPQQKRTSPLCSSLDGVRDFIGLVENRSQT